MCIRDSTCVELGLITINDCDSTIASNFHGHGLTPGVAITTGITDLLDKYKDVFKGLGDLPGEYHTVTEQSHQFEQSHPSRALPTAHS